MKGLWGVAAGVLLGAWLAGGLGASGAEPSTPAAVLSRAEERFRALRDYECIFDSETRAGKKAEKGTYQLWFKAPAALRVRVLRGNHRGSEIARDVQGQVRGREGGLLKPFVISLSGGDRRLRNIRGVPVTDMDWGSFYRKCREHTARGRAVLLPHRSADAPYDIEVTYADRGHRYRELYRIDPRLWVMVEGQTYEDSTLVDHVRFRDIKLDTGIKDSWFRL